MVPGRGNDFNIQSSSVANDDGDDFETHEAPFLPHSEHTVFGLDNSEQYWEHYAQNNFHARILR